MGFTDFICDPASAFDGQYSCNTPAVNASKLAYPPVLSKLLADKFPEKVLRRMRALEKVEAMQRARKLQK